MMQDAKHDRAGAPGPGIVVPGRRAFLAGALAFGLSMRVWAAAKTVRLVVLSDFNESYGSTRYSAALRKAVARTIALRPDAVLSTGDMVAGQRLSPPLDRPAVEAMWQAFHAHVTTPLAEAGLGLAVTPGNHDASSGARFELERRIYREQWVGRKPALDYVDDSGYPFRYAFRVGSVLLVSLDATHIGHVSDDERLWLDRLLQGPGRQASQRVVFSHVPLWPFAVGRERDHLGDERLEAVLQKGGVGLHLSGHHHAYYPGYKDGVRYVSQGCLGAAPRALLGTRVVAQRSITVIDIDGNGQTTVEAYGGEGFDRLIERQTLPEQLHSGTVTLIRDDLAGGPVSPKAVGR